MVLENWLTLFSNQKTNPSLQNHFSPTWKKVDLYYKPTFFSGQPLLLNHFCRTRKIQIWITIFLEQDFSNKISQTTFLHLSRKVVADWMVQCLKNFSFFSFSPFLYPDIPWPSKYSKELKSFWFLSISNFICHVWHKCGETRK